jgi:hypothetical protein
MAAGLVMVWKNSCSRSSIPEKEKKMKNQEEMSPAPKVNCAQTKESEDRGRFEGNRQSCSGPNGHSPFNVVVPLSRSAIHRKGDLLLAALPPTLPSAET